MTVLQSESALPGAGHSSPDWVRISYASALALRFRSGRFTREFDFGGINLLLNYAQGCQSDCGYCGLARSRQGRYEDKSFIRVEWPLVETNELVERMSRCESRLTRLCISMVTHGHAYRDTVDIARRIRRRIDTPLSILVAPPTLNQERLLELKSSGADMIGIGLDAVTEELFRSTRSDVPRGGLDWENYWDIVHGARDIYGPWRVNCHTLVGLGENDRELMETFGSLLERQIFSYLFCFNPEPDSRMSELPKSSVRRWRRIQLAKFLLEESGLEPAAFSFDERGFLERISAPIDLVNRVVSEGFAFMTNGCPGVGGEPGCTRPMGSWSPGDEPRDYPWLPTGEDEMEIRAQLGLEEFVTPGPPPSRPSERCAPPAAGRP
ncbi:MAG: radical SAM protein [Acidobacteriota bacterium]|nr:radical SAM protein [Acidobacteriota bacterium]